MKKTSKKPTGITIDELAQMVANGFKSMDIKFGGINKKFQEIDDGLEAMSDKLDLVERKVVSRINGLENRIDDLALNRVKYEDLVPIKTRIDKIEQKIKV